MSKKRVIVNDQLLDVILRRLAQEIIENHGTMENAILIGLQPRGIFPAERLVKLLEITLEKKITYGKLDATFYRDDFRRRDSILTPNNTEINFVIEDRDVILVDDVLATGRMARAAIDALQAFGRPNKIELLALIDRSYNRNLPIQPDYTGKKVNTTENQKVLVEWREQNNKEDKISLIS